MEWAENQRYPARRRTGWSTCAAGSSETRCESTAGPKNSGLPEGTHGPIHRSPSREQRVASDPGRRPPYASGRLSWTRPSDAVVLFRNEVLDGVGGSIPIRTSTRGRRPTDDPLPVPSPNPCRAVVILTPESCKGQHSRHRWAIRYPRRALVNRAALNGRIDPHQAALPHPRPGQNDATGDDSALRCCGTAGSWLHNRAVTVCAHGRKRAPQGSP